MSSSPRMARYNRSSENGDTDNDNSTRGSSRGLSEYTSQRLAELRARRAERDDNYDYKSTSTRPAREVSAVTTSTTSTTSTAASSGSSENYLESYRARRTVLDSNPKTTVAPKPTTTTTTPSYSMNNKADTSGSRNASTLPYTSSQVSKTNGTDLARSGSSLQRNTSSVGDNEDDECVGFASLPDQVHRKAVKRGFDFTLMVVGETGLGKSTLISSLFLNTDLYKDRKSLGAEDRVAKTVGIEKKYMEIEERGVKLRLTIVDTPGFNDSVNAEQCWKPIERYINDQFDQYYNDESGINRKNIKDHRVHCCLYFVSPFGHGLRQIDVEFMKKLHDKVNIVPIISKADTLTPTEIRKLKSKVLDQVDKHNIRIYEFPDCDSDEDEEFKKQDDELKASVPFAIIGSNTVVEVNGRKIRGRLYPWGIVEVDNPDHCDFLKLRQMLISTHMQDLKDVTRDIHYENYRARHIKEQMNQQQRERNQLEMLRRATGEADPDSDEDSKLKRDSSPNFEGVVEADQLLQQKDAEIRRMQEMLHKMQAQLIGKSGPAPTQVNGLENL